MMADLIQCSDIQRNNDLGSFNRDDMTPMKLFALIITLCNILHDELNDNIVEESTVLESSADVIVVNAYGKARM
jgi:hypothetical protein